MFPEVPCDFEAAKNDYRGNLTQGYDACLTNSLEALRELGIVGADVYERMLKSMTELSR